LLKLAFAQLRRDFYAGELALAALAAMVAVASVTTVTCFIERVRGAIDLQAATLLAADLAIESSYPLTPSIEREARVRGITTTGTVSFRSVVLHGETMQLVAVKAVGDGYPLRGHLQIADEPFGKGRVVSSGPRPGTLWVDPELPQILGLKLGEALELGRVRLEAARILSFEPDRGGQLFQVAPRVMTHRNDVARTGLIGPGSRATYRLLLAGDTETLRRFRAWAEEQLGDRARFITVREARVELRAAIERAEQFLALAALTSVILAGVAIAACARRFADRHLDSAAIMRCLGATQGLVVRVFALELAAMGTAASLIGAGLGYLAQHLLVSILASFAPGELPAAPLLPLLSGTLTGLITLLGFALPPLLGLRHVPPARVLRRDLGRLGPPGLGLYASAVLAIVALAPWRAGERWVTLYVLLGAAGTVVLLAGAAWLLVKLLARLRGRVGIAWRFGLANIARRAGGSVVQVVALGLGIMMMLVVTLVQRELLAEWRASLAPQAPNHFIVNIQPHERRDLVAFLQSRGFDPPKLYPMVRGRLVAINGRPLRPRDYEDPEARRLAERDFNLSWAAVPKSDNRVAAGEWWGPSAHGEAQFSVEIEMAERLGIKLGDRLSYQIAEHRVSGRVSSLRTVEWDSFTVNFFVVAPPGLLERYPTTYITSFYLSDEERFMLTDLVRRFPSVTVVDVAALMDNVRGIMDRASLSMQAVFVFSIIAGLVVLIATLHASRDERLAETALLKTLGASNWRILQGLAAEFLSLGLLAGLLAASAALLVGFVLAVMVFDIDYRFNPWLIPIGVLIGSLSVTAVGMLTMLSSLRESPAATLRRG
jgi:putative ABC transport system permease protein